MKPCTCGCGTMVKGKFARGHWAKTPAGIANAMGIAATAVAFPRSAAYWDDLDDVIRRTDLTYTDEIEIEEAPCRCFKCRAKEDAAVATLRKWFREDGLIDLSNTTMDELMHLAKPLPEGIRDGVYYLDPKPV
jgi:hypothetical protein